MIKKGAEGLFICREEDLDIHKVAMFLAGYKQDLVYIENENHEITGVITEGDLYRHFQSKQPLINRNFKFFDSVDGTVKEEDEEVIIQTFRHNTLRSLPVLYNKKLVCEYKGAQSVLTPFWDYITDAQVSFVLDHFKEDILRTLHHYCNARILICGTEYFIREMYALAKPLNIQFCAYDTDQYPEDLNIQIIDNREELERIPCFINNLFETSLMEWSFPNRALFFGDLFERPLYKLALQELKKKNIKCIDFSLPDWEKLRLPDRSSKRGIVNKMSDEQFLAEFYRDAENIDFAKHDMGMSMMPKNLSRVLVDRQSKYVNISDGVRITVDAPGHYCNKIYMFGPCTINGFLLPDKLTIPNYLQQKINAQLPGSYKVENHGIAGAYLRIQIMFNLLEMQLKEGDIVILSFFPPDQSWNQLALSYGTEQFGLTEAFIGHENWGRWYWDDYSHINHIANEHAAGYMFEKIKDTLFANDGISYQEKPYIPAFVSNETGVNAIVETEDFQKYIQEMKRYAKKNAGKTGCIVMNCNPFTKGHLYLIETAAKEVDTLYLFVVEEDKSYFPFQERFEMIRLGTEHLQKVKLIPSGNYIISSLTFPEYFSKEMLQDRAISPALDVDIFGRHIAPAMGISVRYVGEEPTDKVTEQYNSKLSEVLPKYGIELKIIPRKAIDQETISASKVRKYMELEQWEDVERLVVKPVYDYLKSHYAV